MVPVSVFRHSNLRIFNVLLEAIASVCHVTVVEGAMTYGRYRLFSSFPSDKVEVEVLRNRLRMREILENTVIFTNEFQLFYLFEF